MSHPDETIDIKPRSRVVTDGIEATTSRGMLRAVGMGDADWDKPQIGIASSWNEITPCNLSLDRLAQGAKEGVHAGGGYPLQFGTISVSDGISMGHEGMHFSLVSREVIADSVETVMMAERLDGSVLLAGCDKSIPGMLMASARLDLSSVFLYAGSIAPGWVKLSDGTEKDVTIIDSFEAVGACLAGKMSEADLKRSSFYYADHTLHRPFTYQVSNITLMSRNFDLDAINQLRDPFSPDPLSDKTLAIPE